MGNEIWVWRRVWDIDLTISGWLDSHYPNIPSPHRSQWPGHHTSVSPCDPSCDVWLAHVLITALWAWSWSLSIRARNYQACPLSCLCLVTPGTCSRAPGSSSSDGLGVVTNLIVCPLNPPSQLARSPTPATSCLSTLDITHRKIIYNSNAWGIL